jgi:hypothetical protein
MDPIYNGTICLACRGLIINNMCSRRYLTPHDEKFMETVVEELTELIPIEQISNPPEKAHITAIERAIDRRE